jgi:hypothetical protein
MKAPDEMGAILDKDKAVRLSRRRPALEAAFRYAVDHALFALR